MFSAIVLLATLGRAALDPAAELDALQGSWKLVDVQASSGVKLLMPEATGMTRKGAIVTIKGNELIFEGKVVATLANDFANSGLDVDKQVWVSRRPILFTFPDGKALMCAFEMHADKGFEVVHPHGMGRIGAGQRYYLSRAPAG